jgi:hypothetical protein
MSETGTMRAITMSLLLLGLADCSSRSGAADTTVKSASAELTCRQLALVIDWSNAKDGYAITLTPP